VVFWKPLFKFSGVCLLLEKIVNEKHFSIKEKFSLVFKKMISFILGEKHFLEVAKNSKISCYL
jgi:hypothetical protein